MSTARTKSSEFTLRLDPEEREQLLNVLEQVHRDVLIELHRTDSLEFKELVRGKEAAIRSVLEKLGR